LFILTLKSTLFQSICQVGYDQELKNRKNPDFLALITKFFIIQKIPYMENLKKPIRLRQCNSPACAFLIVLFANLSVHGSEPNKEALQYEYTQK